MIAFEGGDTVKRRWKPFAVLSTILILVLGAIAQGAQAPTDLSALVKRASQAGVEVEVIFATPEYFKARGDEAGLKRYRPDENLVFFIWMNTHSGDLTLFDMRRISTLRTDQGREIEALRWEAISNNPHHRSGVLIFPQVDSQGKRIVTAQSKYVELVFRGLVGVEWRFRWGPPPLGRG